MVLPNADSAFIEPEKVRDYLLSPTHPVGRFKAHYFVALGYRVERWELLRDHLLIVARTGDAMPGKPSPFGAKFEACGGKIDFKKVPISGGETAFAPEMERDVAAERERTADSGQLEHARD